MPTSLPLCTFSGKEALRDGVLQRAAVVSKIQKRDEAIGQVGHQNEISVHGTFRHLPTNLRSNVFCVQVRAVQGTDSCSETSTKKISYLPTDVLVRCLVLVNPGSRGTEERNILLGRRCGHSDVPLLVVMREGNIPEARGCRLSFLTRIVVASV
jgi:hypothetical protein